MGEDLDRIPEIVNISAGIAVKPGDVEGFSVIRSKREKDTARFFEKRREAS